MNVTVNSQSLAQELHLLDKIVPNKPAQPALSSILITAEPMEQQIHLSATDFEVSLQTVCPATIHEPGRMLLPCKKLLDLVEQLPNCDVGLRLDKQQTHLTAGAFQSRLQSIDPANFPQLPTADGAASTLSGTTLKALIDATRYAVASREQKYVLSAALLVLSGANVALIAIDGKRLAVASVARDEAPDATIIIPSKTLDVLVTQPLTGVSVALSQTDKHLFFKMGDRVLMSRMLEGKFTAYQSIIPTGNDKVVVVDRVALAAILRRVGLVSDQSQATYFTLTPDALHIASASADIGDAAETLAVGYQGSDLKVCCNWRYLLDFLEAATHPTITMALKDAQGAMLLTDGDTFLNVILLMRQ